MSNVFTASGAVYAVSAGTPATHDDTGFAALSYTDVTEVTDLGEIGVTFDVVEHQALDRDYTVKRKGIANYGSTQVQLGRDPSDAGQAILQAGADGSEKGTVHSHKITLSDGTVLYFTSQIFGYTTNANSANSIVGATVGLEIDNRIVEVTP